LNAWVKVRIVSRLGKTPHFIAPILGLDEIESSILRDQFCLKDSLPLFSKRVMTEW
jgi:hypothetical protein